MFVPTYVKCVKQNKLSTSSMPNLIEMIQYISTWKADPTARVGNLGTYSNYSYNLIFDASVGDGNSGEKKSNIVVLKSVLQNKNFVNFSKADLFDMFFVYDIPDYGAQAMTTGMTDFDVECYSDMGHKIANRYIAILKSFTTKKAFVLIDKSMIVSDPGTLTIVIEPKTFYNPEARSEKNTKSSEIVKNSIIACNKLDDTKFCFIIDDRAGNTNSTFKFITNPLDYGLYYKSTTDQNISGSLDSYIRVDESAYSMKAESALEFIGSYTNYQTFSGSDLDIYDRSKDIYGESDTSSYRGDYFKQTQAALIKSFNEDVRVYDPSVENLYHNLQKMVPYLLDKPNSTVITVELSANYIGSGNSGKRVVSDQLFLISRQFYKRYTMVSIDTQGYIALPDGITRLSDFEVYAYPKDQLGSVQYENGIRLTQQRDYKPTTTVSRTSRLTTITINNTIDKQNYQYEIKRVGDDKRCIDLLINTPTETIDIAGYLRSGRNLLFNMDLRLCNIKTYQLGKYIKNEVSETNPGQLHIDLIDNKAAVHLVIRDYSTGKYDLEHLVFDGEIENTPLDVADDTSLLMDPGVTDETSVFDPQLSVYEERTALKEFDSLEVYPYDGNDTFYMAVKATLEPVAVLTKEETVYGGEHWHSAVLAGEVLDEHKVYDHTKELLVGEDGIITKLTNLQDTLNTKRLELSMAYRQSLRNMRLNFYSEFKNSNNKLVDAFGVTKLMLPIDNTRYIVLISPDEKIDYQISYGSEGSVSKRFYKETSLVGLPLQDGGYVHVIIPFRPPVAASTYELKLDSGSIQHYYIER